MKIQINNIEFNYWNQGSDLMSDKENIGLAHLTIPGNMSKRFAHECGIKDDGRFIIPHYDYDDMKNHVEFGSDHDCYNSDTQIVLMHWLFQKQKRYKIDYSGLDPFWLFHDSFHAENDVYSNEVNNIYSYIEYQRLLEGAEFAFSKGFEMQPETLAKLNATWSSRWKFREGKNFTPFKYWDFNKFMDKEKQDELEILIECGAFTDNF